MAAPERLKLAVLPHHLGVARLPATGGLPAWLDLSRPMTSITRTREELSVVCPEDMIPAQTRSERGFRAIQVEHKLDFGLTGILATLTGVLAEAQVSVFALSTFDTDYLLVRQHRLRAAIEALSAIADVREA